MSGADAGSDAGQDEGVLLYRSSCLVLHHTLLQQACKVLIATHYLFCHIESAEQRNKEGSEGVQCATTSVYRAHHRLYMCGVDTNKSNRGVTDNSNAENEAVNNVAHASNATPQQSLFASIAEAKACLQQSTLYAILTASHLLRCPSTLQYLSQSETNDSSNVVCVSSLGSLAHLVTRLREDAAWRATALVNLSEYVTRRWADMSHNVEEEDISNTMRTTACLLRHAVETSLYDSKAANVATHTVYSNEHNTACVHVRSLLVRVFPELITGVALTPQHTKGKTRHVDNIFDLYNINHEEKKTLYDIRCGCRHRWLNEDLPRWLLSVALQEHATVYDETRRLRVSFARWRRRRGQRLLRHLLLPRREQQQQPQRGVRLTRVNETSLHESVASHSSLIESEGSAQEPSSIQREDKATLTANGDNNNSATSSSRHRPPVISLLEDSTLSNMAAALHDLSRLSQQQQQHAENKEEEVVEAKGSALHDTHDVNVSRESKHDGHTRREASPPFSDHTAPAPTVTHPSSSCSFNTSTTTTTNTSEKKMHGRVARDHARMAVLKRCFTYWRNVQYYTRMATRYLSVRHSEHVQADCLRHWRRRHTRRRQRRRRAQLAHLVAQLQIQRVQQRRVALFQHWHTAVLARRFLRARLGRRVFVHWRCRVVWARHTRLHSTQRQPPQRQLKAIRKDGCNNVRQSCLFTPTLVTFTHSSPTCLVSWAWQRWRIRYMRVCAQKYYQQCVTRTCFTLWQRRSASVQQCSLACMTYTTRLVHRVLQGWQRNAHDHALLRRIDHNKQHRCCRRGWECWHRQFTLRKAQSAQAATLDMQRMLRVRRECWLVWHTRWCWRRHVAHIHAVHNEHLTMQVFQIWQTRVTLRHKLRGDLDEAAVWCQPRLRLRWAFATWRRRRVESYAAKDAEQRARRVQCAVVWHVRHVWAALFCHWRMRVALRQTCRPQRLSQISTVSAPQFNQGVSNVKQRWAVSSLHAERCLWRMSRRPPARLAWPAWCSPVTTAVLAEDEILVESATMRQTHRATVEGLNASM